MPPKTRYRLGDCIFAFVIGGSLIVVAEIIFFEAKGIFLGRQGYL